MTAKRESIYRCDKYARTHEGCNADGCKESVYKSILVKNKIEKGILEKLIGKLPIKC